MTVPAHDDQTPNLVSTPWGAPQTIDRIALGIHAVTTAGHGGLHLSEALNAAVPDYMRNADGWYEEDVEWAVVALVHPGPFPAADRVQAEATLKEWLPDAWEKWTGRTLAPGESSRRDRAVFEASHAGEQIVVAAWGWPVPGSPDAEMSEAEVLVCARTGGRGPGSRAPDARETWHIIPAADYAACRTDYVVPRGAPETDIRPYGQKPHGPATDR